MIWSFELQGGWLDSPLMALRSIVLRHAWAKELPPGNVEICVDAKVSARTLLSVEASIGFFPRLVGGSVELTALLRALESATSPSSLFSLFLLAGTFQLASLVGVMLCTEADSLEMTVNLHLYLDF
jgi:hypothetical protein